MLAMNTTRNIVYASANYIIIAGQNDWLSNLMSHIYEFGPSSHAVA